MSENRQPHRRRRPQVIAQIPVEEENTTRPEPQVQPIPKEMHRIVVSGGDEPDWMVSANRVSGAAERRGAPAAKEAQPEAAAEPTKKTESRTETAKPAVKAAPMKKKVSAAKPIDK